MAEARTFDLLPKRPPAKPVLDILALVEAGSREDLIRYLADYGGGAIFPFEYDAMIEPFRMRAYAERSGTAKADEPKVTVEEVQAAWDAIKDDPHYTWPFQTGDKVTPYSSCDNLTQGRAYFVEGCYIGESWRGGGCYVKLEGFDYGISFANFLRYEDFVALKTARENGGILRRLALDWTGHSMTSAISSAETVDRLIAQGALVRAGGVVVLGLGSSVVRRLGWREPPAERVAHALRLASIGRRGADASLVAQILALEA